MTPMDDAEALDFIQRAFSYYTPEGDQALRYNSMRNAAKEFAMAIISNVPAGRERTVAMERLRESAMWANIGIITPR